MITIKSKEEVAILREGGRRHARILREIASMVVPGVTARELDQKAAELIRRSGDKAAFLNHRPAGAKRAFPASLIVSINDEVVHGIPNEAEKVLQEGDIVSLDLGLIHQGLVTDMAITVPVGKVSKDRERLIRATKEALMAGIKAAKGGKRVGDIGSAIERVAVSNGFSIADQLSGHGVGYSVHEDPFVPNFGDPGTGVVLKPGMVLALEPLLNAGASEVLFDQEDGWTCRTADGSDSAHFEHTIVITKGEAEIITQ